MAITRSAKKANRQSEKKRATNDIRRKSMREAVKNTRKSLATGDSKNLKEEMRVAFMELDKAAKLGVIKKGNASRKKARLAKALAKMK